MAWSRVAGATLGPAEHAADAATVNMGTLGAAVTSGDRIIIALSVWRGGDTEIHVTGITDSLGNTWTNDLTSGDVVDAPTHFTTDVWSTLSVAGTPANITASL